MTSELKSVGIVGGGVIGCSVAYHLTKLGITDIILLERKQLTSGTTWHAAGLVPTLRANYSMSMLANYSASLYATLEAETGQATGYTRNGSITVATNKERFSELKRGASMARVAGFPCDIIDPEQAKALWPLLNINGSLIGINTAIYQKAEGIGFAIPIDHARRIVDELIRYGKVRRGWLGVSVLEENIFHSPIGHQATFINLPVVEQTIELALGMGINQWLLTLPLGLTETG